jgi:glutamate/tyrosine decarboxylase-like PLP-dependent enzyme
MQEMHRYTKETEALARAVVGYATERIRMDPPPLDRRRSSAELREAAGRTITPEGIGGHEALRVFAEVLAPATISTDHPTNLAYVPGAPTKASVLFDLVVGASSIIGAGWIDGAGAVFAENEALAWLAGVLSLPEGAGGAFVSGGSAGNLAGLVAARHTAGTRGDRPRRWRVATADHVHSSVKLAARVIDVDVLPVPHDERGRLTRAALQAELERDGEGVFAVVATAGTTNAGIVDDLAGVADVCRDRGLWLHVDAAYGGAAALVPEARPLFDGIERADSLVVDPHKWLFAPYDCAALLYRDPELARAAHAQEAEYLSTANAQEEWSPMHYAYHLSRRVRGLPFWFSLATYGTDAYREAVASGLRLARETAEEIRVRDELELVLDPELSVVLFRRLGWDHDAYVSWCDRLLEDQLGFLQPTAWEDEPVMRFCFVNPRTTIDDVRRILDTMT